MKTAKFAGPAEKPKRVRKMHITGKEYRQMTAGSVNDSLNRFFKRKKRP